MPEQKVKVNARVRCEIDIPVGLWGADSVLQSLATQVRKEGVNKIRDMVSKANGHLIGEPKVVFVMTEEE